MKRIEEINWCILIRKHIILFIIKSFKILFFLLIIWIICYFLLKYIDQIKNINSLNYLLFWLIFILFNYYFISFIVFMINYYNDLIILHNDQIIIIKTYLIMKDDVEIIDINDIVKVDLFSHWIFQNILWYGTIIIEHQKYDFIPNPHLVVSMIEKQKKNYKNKRRWNINEIMRKI